MWFPEDLPICRAEREVAQGHGHRCGLPITVTGRPDRATHGRKGLLLSLAHGGPTLLLWGGRKAVAEGVGGKPLALAARDRRARTFLLQPHCPCHLTAREASQIAVLPVVSLQRPQLPGPVSSLCHPALPGTRLGERVRSPLSNGSFRKIWECRGSSGLWRDSPGERRGGHRALPGPSGSQQHGRDELGNGCQV